MMELPNEITNKIMLYNSHPVADLFKEDFIVDLTLYALDKYLCDHDKGYCKRGDRKSFAHHYFHPEYSRDIPNEIYYQTLKATTNSRFKVYVF